MTKEEFKAMVTKELDIIVDMDNISCDHLLILSKQLDKIMEVKRKKSEIENIWWISYK